MLPPSPLAPRPALLFLACLNLSGAVITISSLTGPALSGSFVFGGSLASDGEFNFATDGSPLSSPTFTVAVPTGNSYELSSSGTLTGSFSMTGSLSEGTYNFSSSGSPLTSPAFSAGGQAFSNLPNGNDRYQVSGGNVTAVKYDLSGGAKSLNLSLDGSYSLMNGSFSVTETGTYSLAVTAIGSANRDFSNQPNQNDRYVVGGGQVTALKYDLSAGGYQLLLRTDGSFQVLSDFSTVGSGTYELTTVPEPGPTATWAGIALLVWAVRQGSPRRR